MFSGGRTRWGRSVEGMEMIVKILACLALILCGVSSTFFAACGFAAFYQDNMESVAKSAMLVGVLMLAEVLCILELTRNE